MMFGIDDAGTVGIDLFAMSGLGQTGMGRWVFESVTDKVLRAGHMPVLVI